MKKYIKYFAWIAAAAFAVVSCQEEVQPHQPGEPDASGCYGVYFPTQAASGMHVYSPVQDPSVEITLKRTNTTGSISVPIVATCSEEGIFTVGDATFADGQDETTFMVSFPTAQEGTTYTASFTIEDTQYASMYSSNAISLDFSVMRVQMVPLKDESGKEAVVTFHVKNDFLGDFGVDVASYDLEGKIEYYEVDNVRYCQVVVPADGGIWGADAVINFTWYPKQTYTYGDAAYQPLEVAVQYTGYSLDGAEVGEDHPCRVLFCDYYHHYSDLKGNSLGTFFDFMKNYGANYKLSYYDGHGGFYFNLVYDIEGTNYWYGFCDGSVVGIASGYTRTDFTMKGIEAGFTEDGKLPLSFYAGENATKIAFVVAAGELTATQISNQVNAIADGSAEDVVVLAELAPAKYKGKDVVAAGAEVTLPETGVYTVVAVSYNDKDKPYDSASTTANYVAAGDVEAMAVDITTGVGSAAKYKGANTDSSVEAWIYGSDIVDAKMIVVSYMDLMSSADDVLAAVKAAKSLPAAAIEAINGDGYVTLAQGLLPGTEYYSVVWASNGFEEGVFISDEGVYTTGDPLPIYQTFTANSWDDDAELADRSEWLGDWNYYAVDYYGETGLREFIGPVSIAASETPTEGPDDYGLYDEYAIVDGLFGDLAYYAAYGYDLDGQVEMDVYGGAMYSCSNTNVPGDCSIHIYSKGRDSWMDYAHAYFSAFIPVMDGYYAFVDCSSYASSYNFTGLRIVSDYVWNAYYDLLLVDPNKDDNGLSQSSINAAVLRARKLMKASAAEVDKHLVLNGKARAKAIIDTYKQMQKGVTVYDDFQAVDGTCPVKTVSVSVKCIAPAVYADSAVNQQRKSIGKAVKFQ